MAMDDNFSRMKKMIGWAMNSSSEKDRRYSDLDFIIRDTNSLREELVQSGTLDRKGRLIYGIRGNSLEIDFCLKMYRANLVKIVNVVEGLEREYGKEEDLSSIKENYMEKLDILNGDSENV